MFAGMDGSLFWAALISAVLALAHLAICVAALGVIPGNRKPSTGMAWLILILAVPFFGFIAFLLFGSTHVERRRHDKQRHVNDLVRQRTAAIPSGDATSGWRAAHASAAILNRNLGTLPVVAGNTVELHPDYVGYFAAMTEAVDEAQHFVHVEFYISTWDTTTSDFFDALVRASKRGVTVRVLFDHLGSRSSAGYRRDARSARRGRDRLESHAGDRSPPGKVPASGSAQPPQDPGGGQHDGLHGVAEPDRDHVRQGQEPEGRTGVRRAQPACSRSGGTGAEPGVRHGLVQRDRRDPGRRAAAAHPIRTSTRHRLRWSAKSCRAGPASPRRTTCGCSPR